MNAASLHRSDRLRRVHAVLSDGQEHSTLDLVLEAGVCAVNSIVSELRANGVAVACRRSTGAAGQPLWLYRLAGGPGGGERG